MNSIAPRWCQVAVIVLTFAFSAEAQVSPVDLVHVMVGTAAQGQTFPAAGVPFAMTQWTPQTRAGEVKCVAPYYAADLRIQGFRGSHFLSGSCTQDYGSFTIMPLPDDSLLDPASRASGFARASEHATPYAYSVGLERGNIHAEITGSLRAGIMRFRYAPGQKKGWIALDNNVRLGLGHLRIDAERQEIVADNPVYRIYAGQGQPAGFSGYAVVQFDRIFHVGGTYTGTQRSAGAASLLGDGAPGGGYVWFDLPADESLQVRIGTSFTSIEEARKNLAAEIPDWNFDATRDRARAAWTAAFAPIQVAGSSPDRHIFYTAMYHAMLAPRTYSDHSGTYPKFGGGNAIELADGFTYYCDYSVWDSFRAVHPLFTVIDPDRELDMVKSLIAKGEQGGFLPIFPAWNSYTNEMTGDHADAIIADAYVKGIRHFDAEEAYRLMKKNATEQPQTPALYRDGHGRRALGSYLKYGYIPLEDHVPEAFHQDEQVSRTLDYAFDDFEVETMAQVLGHVEDARQFAQRAQNYRNVIDPAVGFARGRHADGTWVTPFEPATTVSYITEATPYVDTFSVLQDIPGLMDILHGPEAFVRKLDGLFSGGYYDHGNEPSHHIAYLYDDAGVPSKTQMHVHAIMSTLYHDSDGGLAGNDDGGQMSAWYVFSALGFYPVTPGTPRYAIGTPHFDDVRVRSGSGRVLHIRAKGAEQGKFYVHAVRLNRKLLGRPWILQSEILDGGELEFEMSDHPDAKAPVQ